MTQDVKRLCRIEEEQNSVDETHKRRSSPLARNKFRIELLAFRFDEISPTASHPTKPWPNPPEIAALTGAALTFDNGKQCAMDGPTGLEASRSSPNPAVLSS